MAPTKEYALLCLENPLLGMFNPLDHQLKVFPSFGVQRVTGNLKLQKKPQMGIGQSPLIDLIFSDDTNSTIL